MVYFVQYKIFLKKKALNFCDIVFGLLYIPNYYNFLNFSFMCFIYLSNEDVLGDIFIYK